MKLLLIKAIRKTTLTLMNRDGTGMKIESFGIRYQININYGLG